MYRQESVQTVFPGEAAWSFNRVVAQKFKEAAGSIRSVLGAIAEPFRGPWTLELLDPKLRAGMSVREKAIVDAYLHGVM